MGLPVTDDNSSPLKYLIILLRDAYLADHCTTVRNRWPSTFVDFAALCLPLRDA